MSGWRTRWGAVFAVVTAALVVSGGAEDCDSSGDGPMVNTCTSTGVLPDDGDLNEDSDSASFLIVIEHEDGWRCAASLVSIRTAVTSARCARGRAETLPRELWALAASQLARRPPHSETLFAPRPSSPAVTARRVSRLALAGDRRRGDDAIVDDLAVVELESPFGQGAHVRPILMASSRDECEKEPTCHAVRTMPAEGTHRARFRVVSAAIVSATHCAARVHRWSEFKDRSFCLSGDDLCTNDRGTGVVCGGKLCGVLSDSVLEAGAGSGQMDCGETHVAQIVARWRAFLHCAHTLRACGRGDCESLCSEHRLLNGDSTTETESEEVSKIVWASPSSSSQRIVPIDYKTETEKDPDVMDGSEALPIPPGPPIPPPRRNKQPPTSRTTTTHTEATTEATSESNQAFTPRVPEFEPNRPDFKAGEYGDNAAEYEEPVITNVRTQPIARQQHVTRSPPPVLYSITRTHSMSMPRQSPPPAESLRSTATPYHPVAHSFLCISQLTLLMYNNCLALYL